MEIIKVSEKNKARLLQLAGELQTKERKRITMDNVVSFLLDYYFKNENKAKKLNLTEIIKKYQFNAKPIPIGSIDEEIYK